MNLYHRNQNIHEIILLVWEENLSKSYGGCRYNYLARWYHSWAWTLDFTVISACGMFVAFGINGIYTRSSVESSEYLSDLLKSRNIPHNVLNARPKVCKLLI